MPGDPHSDPLRSPPPAWARLVTPFPYCWRHSEDDGTITRMLRRKSVNVDPGTFNVHPDTLDVRRFPVLFTNNLTSVTEPSHLKNLQEYLLRGGFIYIDACANAEVTPSYRRFSDTHLALLTGMVEGAQVRLLTPSHPIFHALYPVSEARLLEFYREREPAYHGVFDAGTRPALYAVFDDDRIMAVVSQHFLRCTWNGQSAEEESVRKEMAVNIHGYAFAAFQEA